MSAFEVSDVHIHAMLTAGLDHYPAGGNLRWMWPDLSPEEQEGAYQAGSPWGPDCGRLAQERSHELTAATAGRVGAMLRLENRRSVDFRYAEAETEDPYVFSRLSGEIDPVIVLKAIDCYEYQSCEHPDWQRSEAHEFCRTLRKRMIHILPGYDAAPWEISDERVFCERQTT